MSVIETITALSYLLAASLFIIGLKYMSSPATARKGNLIAGIGMLLAIIVTLLDRQIVSFSWIFAGILIGSAVGAVAAYRVHMTAMPQMVGAFNGFGGGASALVAVAEFYRAVQLGGTHRLDTLISILLGVIIGTVTFTGSFVAFGKLQGFISGAPITFRGQKVLNSLLLAAMVGLSVYLAAFDTNLPLFLIVTALAFLYGILFVIPIGGADMPVVISLLNSFSGLAAAAAGFVVENNILIIAGTLVGSAGLILTQIMCKAMNRSLSNVLFSAFGTGDEGGGADAASAGLAVRTLSKRKRRPWLWGTRSRSLSYPATAWPLLRRSMPCAN